MKTLEQLNAHRASILEALAEADRNIASHPDTIWSHFQGIKRDLIESLVGQLETLVPVSGWTDSRKNPMQWGGFEYSFWGDETKYWCRAGEKYSFQDCGLAGDEACADKEHVSSVYEEHGSADEPFVAHVLTLPKHEAVAYLLWCSEGW